MKRSHLRPSLEERLSKVRAKNPRLQADLLEAWGHQEQQEDMLFARWVQRETQAHGLRGHTVAASARRAMSYAQHFPCQQSLDVKVAMWRVDAPEDVTERPLEQFFDDRQRLEARDKFAAELRRSPRIASLLDQGIGAVYAAAGLAWAEQRALDWQFAGLSVAQIAAKMRRTEDSVRDVLESATVALMRLVQEPNGSAGAHLEVVA